MLSAECRSAYALIDDDAKRYSALSTQHSALSTQHFLTQELYAFSAAARAAWASISRRSFGRSGQPRRFTSANVSSEFA